MSKEADRAALEAMMAAHSKPVTKIDAAPMDASLSASFRKFGIDKKTQKIAPSKPKKQKQRVKRVKRNWEAQRRYDEIHGTVNGYDERIEEARAMRDYESGDY